MTELCQDSILVLACGVFKVSAVSFSPINAPKRNVTLVHDYIFFKDYKKQAKRKKKREKEIINSRHEVKT